MKVLIINAVCGTGSTGRIVSDMYSLLTQQGNDVKVAYGIGCAKGVPEKDCIKISSKIDYYVHNALSRITDRAGFYSMRHTLKLIRFMDEFHPDLVQLHNIHGYYINIKLLFNYFRNNDIPVVWTLHDCWAFTGHCVYFSYAQCEKWKTQCQQCPLSCNYPQSIVFDRSKHNYIQKRELIKNIRNLTIVTPSRWLADLAKLSFLRDRDIRVINNGIDTNVFTYRVSNFKAQYGLENKKMVLAVSNVWEERKGLSDVIRVAETLNQDYTVVIVGLTAEQKEKLPDRVIGLERTNNAQELAEIYSCADVFINTTYEDNYPTVNLEAISCGTPVVTYRTGGSPEIVEETGAGLVVKQGDIVGLCSAIERISSMGIQDMGDYREQLGKDAKFQQYIDLYHSILTKKDR